MKRFKNILLVCDSVHVHEESIDRALWLAKTNDASISVVDVIDAAPGELTRLFGALPGTRAQDVEYEVVEFHRSRLAEAAAPIRAQGIETNERVLQGIPFVEIITKVLRDDHDLVIKGAVTIEKNGSPALGSEDMHLVRKCPCPVWIIKTSQQRKYGRILAAVDPNNADEQKTKLNTLIMDLATSLSAMDNSELHVVTAWGLEEEETLRHSGFARVAKDEISLLIDDQRRQTEANLNTLLAPYPNDETTRYVHLVKGPALEVIPNLAKEQQVGLIVMGTVGRTGIQGLIIGNTAEGILNTVDCAVLAAKPPGFESPVQLNGRAPVDVDTHLRQ